MATPKVPTHRQFLTSLIDSLSLTSIPAATSSSASASVSAPNTDRNSNGNPLKRLPPTCRPLFTTLYALYPLILLPALDLLDRRLATRVFVRTMQEQDTVIMQTETGVANLVSGLLPSRPDPDSNIENVRAVLQQQRQDTTAQTDTRPAISVSDAPPDRPTTSSNTDKAKSGQGEISTGSHIPPSSLSSPSSNIKDIDIDTQSTNTYFLVRSAQPQQTRRHWKSNATAPSGPCYVVRLDAWNCTCAAFAFAAFPREDDGQSYVIEPISGLSKTMHMKGRDTDGDGDGKGQIQSGDDKKWEFGALSVDGKEGSGIAGVPCCKHLLACLLAERWKHLLGEYVEERVVGREEGVGLVADI